MLGSAGCGEEDSRTQLNPAGPPMVRQVFMEERVMVDTNDDGTPDSERTRTQLAFGTHKDISDADDPKDGVSNALAANNTIRVVIDELLDGSTMEQVACGRLEDGVLAHFDLDDGDETTLPITNPHYSNIVSGSNPDDIADCTGVDRSRCTAACTTAHVPHGTFDDSDPIGVLDLDDDGAADAFRFKEGVVSVICDGTEMPLDLEAQAFQGHTDEDEIRTFWNPSGNQQIPAGTVGVAGLGPAVVIKPTGLRTGSSCSIEFDDSIVDKDGEPVCAPPNGDVDAACPGRGDTSLIPFGTQVFSLVGSAPTNDQQYVRLNTQVLLQFNLDVDSDTVGGNVSLADAGGAISSTIQLESDNAIVSILPDANLQPETEYTISITGGASGVKEVFGGGLAEDIEVTFTTCLAEGSTCASNGQCCAGTCEGDPMVCTAPASTPDAAPDVDADTTPDAGAPDAAM